MKDLTKCPCDDCLNWWNKLYQGITLQKTPEQAKCFKYCQSQILEINFGGRRVSQEQV